MLPVARASDDSQVRKMPLHELGSAQARLDVVDRQHQHLRVFRAGRAQHFQARRVAVVQLVAETAHEIDLRRARFECREGDAPRSQQACHDLSDPAEARDQDAWFLRLDLVEDRGRRRLAVAAGQTVGDADQHRGERHRRRHDENQQVCGARIEQGVTRREREQHEREFAAAREHNAETPGRRPGHGA